jgi:hypothetical protein
MRPPSFQRKNVSTCMGSSTARGSSAASLSTVRMLPSLKRTRSAPRNSTRFAAQYPARGHPCERFAAGLATRLAHHSGPRRLAIPYLAEDLHLLFFRQRDWRTPLW